MINNTPTLISALVCDQVITSIDGKHNLIGLFSDINATTFPTHHPHMVLFCGWINNSFIGKYDLKVVIRGSEDGKELAKIENVVIEFKSGKKITYAIFNFENVAFEQTGEYHFEVFLNKQSVVKIPIVLRQLSN